MSAPDRAVETAAIVNQHRDLFGSDDRRRGILFYICAELNAAEGDTLWGVLEKGDQGNFIPSDVIVYRATMEHFDVLQGAPDGPSWQPKGVIQNPTWRWTRATVDLFAPGTAPTTPPPEPPAPPAPPRPPAGGSTRDYDEDVERFLDALERLYDGFAGIAEALQAQTRAIERQTDAGLRPIASALEKGTDLVLEVQRDGIRMRLR